MILQLIELLRGSTLVPSKVDRVSENITYIGYPAPTCKGDDDPKWAIQLKITSGTVETIGFANGTGKFDQAWSNRKNLQYKITAVATSSFDESDADL